MKCNHKFHLLFHRPLIKNVSTWSPLATAFNSRPTKKLNLTMKNNTGLFGIPELCSYEGFYALKDHAEWETEKFVEEICEPQRSRKMVGIFDDLSDTLCRVADLAEFIRIGHPSASFRQAAEDACISVSGIVEKLNVHNGIYSALKNVVETNDVVPISSLDDHVAKLFLFDFEQCGIHLPDSERQKVVHLNNSILQLGQRFMSGAVNPRIISKDVVPESIRHLFSKQGDNVFVSNLYADSSNPVVRETAYKLFLHPDPHQEYFLDEMLNDRNELAKLCGFKTFSERALRSSTAETPEMVMRFLNKMREDLSTRAEQDFKLMQKMKESETPNCSDLAAWDTPYFSQKVKQEWLNMGNLEFSPYFSLGACMDGLNTVFSNLYGICLVNEEVENGELWTSDVYKLGVYHESEGLLGYIYCDFYERNGKPNQDCHFTIRGGRKLSDGSYQNPIVVLMVNLPTPRWSGPSLLSPGMVDNLFHEMGHAMHSMLARTPYQHITGTRCSTDFAEVPSVLMEYFASDPRVIRSFARHFQTQEPMPEAMLARLCASKHLFAASELQMQVFYSALDQTYHGEFPLKSSTTEVLKELQGQYYGLPYVPNTAWQLRFSHLVGYGAKYYSYLLSRAVASWIWQQYFSAEPFSRSSGEKYRRECLAHGGGKPSKQLVADFLDKEVSEENLASAIINEIDIKSDQINKIK